MKQLKKIIYVFIITISVLCFNNLEVNAITLTNRLLINSTQMNTSTRLYTAGSQNMDLLIRPSSSSVVDHNNPRYGYVALCNAAGSSSSKYISTVSSNLLTDIAVVNSTVGCTIPGTSAYRTTSRVLYITFQIPYTNYDCSVSGGTCLWEDNLTLAWWEPSGGNEYSLISYGFSYDPYNFNESVDPSVLQNDSIINNGNETNEKLDETNDKLDETNDNLDKIDGSVNDLNDSINNSSVDNPGSKIEEFENMLPENGVITQLITLPISLFQKVLSSINGTCQEYNLGNLFGTDLTLPCVNISNYLGATLWNVIDVLFSGLFVLVISKKMIKVFNNFTSMEEGDVLD